MRHPPHPRVRNSPLSFATDVSNGEQSVTLFLYSYNLQRHSTSESSANPTMACRSWRPTAARQYRCYYLLYVTNSKRFITRNAKFLNQTIVAPSARCRRAVGSRHLRRGHRLPARAAGQSRRSDVLPYAGRANGVRGAPGTDAGRHATAPGHRRAMLPHARPASKAKSRR